MKTARLLEFALVALSSLSVVAQQASATAQQSTAADVSGGGQVSQPGAQASGSASRFAAVEREMRPVNTELTGKLDSKTAKAGDLVVVKTTEAMRTADGTAIPKGSRLLGHVTFVQSHGKESENSQMAIQFNRAELKGGQSVAIVSEIESVSPSATAMAMSSTQSDDSLANVAGGGMGSGRMGGGAPGGGGLAGGAVGGVTGGSARTAAGTTGRMGTGLGATADDTVRGSVGAVSNVGMTAGASGGFTAHATGIRGVLLAADATGATSGILSASKQNIHLDSGSQLMLGVTTAR
ncbi:MAG: hypothetical protein ABSD67_13715 [Terracidiphilus sp.]